MLEGFTATAYAARLTQAVRHRMPVAARTCIECHMPGVQVRPELRFTNHWIGVYAKGLTLRPRRPH